MIEKVQHIVLDDRRVKVREIADTVNISIDRVHKILTEELEMKKYSVRWVPELLTSEQKLTHLSVSCDLLARFRCNQKDFMRRFITVDETWIHHYTVETKEQSKQWIRKDSTPPKKTRTVLSAGQVMATVFWDSH